MSSLKRSTETGLDVRGKSGFNTPDWMMDDWQDSPAGMSG